MARLTLDQKIEAAEYIRDTYLPPPGSGLEPIPHLFVREMLGANTWRMQDEITKSVFENKLTAVKTCNAVGKALALDTPLLTTSGWKIMADIKVGDKVFSPNGKPVAVTHVHPIRKRETYRVIFDNESSIVCDGDHLWTVLTLKKRYALARRDTDWRDYWHEGETLTTRYMVEHVQINGVNNYLIPATHPLESPERDDDYTASIKLTDHLITAIEKVDTVPTRCITVANDDGLFLVGRALIPTHNSFIAARIALTWLTLYDGSKVITTAPTWRQVKDVLWREFAVANRLSKVKLTSKEVKQAGLDIDKDWYAVGLSTKYPENFFGYHAAHLLAIVDEAGGVPPIIFKGVKAITPNSGAHILYIGNPTNPEGPFFDVFDNPKILAKRFSVSIFDSPNFVSCGIRNTDELVAIFTPPPGADELAYARRVNDELYAKMDPAFRDVLIDPYTSYQDYLEWGADSNAWQSLRLGEFPSQADNALIPVELVSMAMHMKGTDVDSGETYAKLSGWNIPEGPPELGLDVARFGPDLNVLTPRHGGWVEPQQKWNKKGDEQKDLWETAERTLKVMDVLDWNTRLNLDDTGLGGGVSSHIRYLGKKEIDAARPPFQFIMQPYNMASKEFMREPDKFYDITSELYWNLRGWFYRKEIALDYDKNLFNQLVSRRWKIVGGKIKVESKDEYKLRTKGKSPDESDSLALAFSGGNRNISINSIATDSSARAQPVMRPTTAGINPYVSGSSRQF